MAKFEDDLSLCEYEGRMTSITTKLDLGKLTILLATREEIE